jgi:hypothetical protein
LEVDVPAVDLDVKAVIPSMSLQIRFASPFSVHAFVARLVLPASARGAPSFSLCEAPKLELMPFPSRSLGSLLYLSCCKEMKQSKENDGLQCNSTISKSFSKNLIFHEEHLWNCYGKLVDLFGVVNLAANRALRDCSLYRKRILWEIKHFQKKTK